MEGTGLKQDVCWKCAGGGVLRNNMPTASGYTFGQIVCDECSGSGRIDYLTCEDCGSVVPAYCFSDHECGD